MDKETYMVLAKVRMERAADSHNGCLRYFKDYCF